MQPIEAFVRNPVKVAVGVLLVALFGTISMITMPKQLTPEVQNPVITIETRWPGASPQEVEREIVQEQEERLKSVEGVIKMSSESTDSVGRITLEFLVGTNFEEALLRVNTRLQQVPQYPVDAEEPVISSRDISDRPIARFALMAKPPSVESIEEFQRQNPALAEAVEPARRAMNPGLRVFRLQQLADELGDGREAIAELLPPDIDMSRLRKFTEDVIEARLERVPGVSDAEVSGGLEEELQVVVDPQQLAARGLTITDLRDVLRRQNNDTSGGDFWEGKRRWVVRTLGQFTSEEHVARQLVAVSDGAPIFVEDVARVQLGFKKPDSVSRRYGQSSISLSVQRETGANVLEVMKGLAEATDELNRDALARQQLELFQYYDETEYIYSAMRLVQQNIFIGGALTMIVLMLFLHRGLRTLLVTPLIAATAVAAVYVSPWCFVVSLLLIVVAGFWFSRGALIVGLAIPTSIVGTFLLLGLLGRSLNVISLAGLAFAVGMLVDNAVVVLENIHRRWSAGEAALWAAVRGTQEVAGAVVASTLTTIAVFLPVVFIEEMAGQLFRDIALAISCAVGLSLVISFTLIPAAASRLFRDRRAARGTPAEGVVLEEATSEPTAEATRRLTTLGTRAGGASARRILAIMDRTGQRLVGWIVGLNRWIARSHTRAMAVVLLLVSVSIGLSWLFWPKVEYLPAGNRNFVFAFLSPPPGYNMDQLAEMGREIEVELRPHWDPDPAEVAASDLPVINYYFFVVRGPRVIMGVRADDPTRVRELIPILKQAGTRFPGTIGVAKQSSLFERGLTGGRTIDIEITGPDLEHLVSLGGRVLADVHRLMPEAQALPQPSLDLANPEVHVVPKLVQAADMGIRADDLGYTIDALVDGAYAGDYFVGGDKIDLTIRADEQLANRTQNLMSLPLATRHGDLVPLGALATVHLSSGPEQINRRERQRAITVQVTPPATVPLEAAMQQIQAEILAPLRQERLLEGGYRVTLSGTADKLRETWHALRWNIALALIITYLLMAALFESWLYPLVIIFSVPLGAVGGILGLRLLNLFVFQPLDVLTMLGFVILIGTVVNNAILIVHQSLNHIRLDGMTADEAILESVRTRVRPIFITTMTTVLGLLPLVLFPGAGSELYRGLGSVVLGGLIVSTFFTLVLVPTVFHLTMDAKDAFNRLRRAPRPRRPGPRVSPPEPIASP